LKGIFFGSKFQCIFFFWYSITIEILKTTHHRLIDFQTLKFYYYDEGSIYFYFSHYFMHFDTLIIIIIIKRNNYLYVYICGIILMFNNNISRVV
jgi:hypothetical protein